MIFFFLFRCFFLTPCTVGTGGICSQFRHVSQGLCLWSTQKGRGDALAAKQKGSD